MSEARALYDFIVLMDFGFGVAICARVIFYSRASFRIQD